MLYYVFGWVSSGLRNHFSCLPLKGSYCYVYQNLSDSKLNFYWADIKLRHTRAYKVYTFDEPLVDSSLIYLKEQVSNRKARKKTCPKRFQIQFKDENRFCLLMNKNKNYNWSKGRVITEVSIHVGVSRLLGHVPGLPSKSTPKGFWMGIEHEL